MLPFRSIALAAWHSAVFGSFRPLQVLIALQDSGPCRLDIMQSVAVSSGLYLCPLQLRFAAFFVFAFCS